MQQQNVFFNAAGPVLAEANANPTELNIARGLVAATEEFKRGCSQEGSHGEPWACQACTEAYLNAVRKLTTHTTTVESPIEITLSLITEQVRSTLGLKEGEVPTPEQLLRTTTRLSPERVFVGELSDDPQRVSEFLASVEAQTNKPE